MSERPTTFFSNHSRTLDTEDEIILTSVGVDIGSSTSHLVFSKIVMDRRDNRYVVASRDVLFESEIMLTPYREDTTIDAERLQVYLDRQYEKAGMSAHDIDAGALILTGVAVRRKNARAIANLFADQAGKFVAVSAGDSLEAALVAYGSGAAGLSAESESLVMNVDIGGGTSKIALCQSGAIIDRTAIDIGARVICFDEAGCVTVIEDAGRRFAEIAGVSLRLGDKLSAADIEKIVDRMADSLVQAMGADDLDGETVALHRLDPLKVRQKPDLLSFSGGVSEYIYRNEVNTFGDLGAPLSEAVLRRINSWGVEVRTPVQGIRATVIGASQYTIQLSGSTIFVQPDNTLPLKNLAVIHPRLSLSDDVIAPDAVARAIFESLRHQDMKEGDAGIALFLNWAGPATFRRLDDLCKGIIAGLEPHLSAGQPLVLVTDSDVGGLIGLHCYDVCELPNPIVSIDGIELNEFDYIDVGALVDASGAVPVVIKSLVFPSSAAVGRGNERIR